MKLSHNLNSFFLLFPEYHPLRYMGSRKAVIASTEHEYDPDNCTSTTTRNHFDLGISSLIIGIIFLLISIAAFMYGKKTNCKY